MDTLETVAVDQIFTGNVFFKSGQPWVDVRAFGAGAGAADDSDAINKAIAAAVAKTDGDAAGNAIVYFPTGDYSIANTILPPRQGSNYTLMGAGVNSSRLVWRGPIGKPMLKLVNARNVRIADLTFYGSSSFPPSYGIEINRAAGAIDSEPSEILVERVTLGSPATDCMDTAIGFTADPGQDSGGNFGTFRNVEVACVKTGFRFGISSAVGHHVIAGGCVSCSTAAIDNTPAAGSSFGGNYTVLGSSFSSNKVSFRVGQTLGGAINIVGMQGEGDIQLLHTPATLGNQSVRFYGGQLTVNDPSHDPKNQLYDTVKFDATDGSLEFHGFKLVSGNGVRWNFPNSGRVAFFGGLTGTLEWKYNGSLQLYGLQDEAGSPTFTNLGKGSLQKFGSYGHLTTGQAKLNCKTGAAAGIGASATVAGSDVGGTITLTTGDSGLGEGSLLQINFATPFNSVPVMIIGSANSATVGELLAVYTTPNGKSSFFLNAATALAPSTQYQWTYFVVG